MNWKDIRYGESYRIRHEYGRGRAVVNGQEIKKGVHYRFPVIFPDNNGKMASEDVIESRDFINKWTEGDERRLNESRRQRAEIKAIEVALKTAGYESQSVRTIRDELYVSFQGDSATATVKLLLANPISNESNDPHELVAGPVTLSDHPLLGGNE